MITYLKTKYLKKTVGAKLDTNLLEFTPNKFKCQSVPCCRSLTKE